jgi:hypothetical protein
MKINGVVVEAGDRIKLKPLVPNERYGEQIYVSNMYEGEVVVDCVKDGNQFTDDNGYWYTEDMCESILSVDAINPAHYKSNGKRECIEYTERMPFCEGNAFKYVWRAGLKDTEEQELKKALWYLERANNSADSADFEFDVELVYWVTQETFESWKMEVLKEILFGHLVYAMEIIEKRLGSNDE